MDVNIGSGSNYFEFKVDLTDEEFKELYDLMKQCKNPIDEDCKCHVHDKLDIFDSKNSSRRIILVDDYDRWV